MKQSEIEKKILEFWKENDTFRKSVDKEAPQGDFVFYDGPPFATGTPHYGHIVASLLKDMVPRYWTMRGFRVERRWGWDCHGLPIEYIVEKEHGFKHKKDILAYGVDKFNEDARGKVLMYTKEWREVIERLGRWVDMDNDYKTMDLEFMESVWWVFKQLYDKDLLYEAYRSMHICPRCETTLAQSEVAQGYKDVQDLSVVVKFKVKNFDVILEGGRRPTDRIHLKNTGSYRSANAPLQDDNNVYLLAWTTTPWTLPGNAALAVSGDILYSIVELNNEHYILAKERLATIFKDKEYKLIKDIKGRDLIGLSFEPLFPYYDNGQVENHSNAFKVYAADFVNTEEGTGIVHIAPAFGEDDMSLGKKEKLPFIQHVNMDGTFKKKVTDFAGLAVKHQDAPDTVDHPEDKVETTDIKIIKYLAAKNLLFSKAKYTHSYPHCWRCDSPLLNYAASSWFVAVEKIKKDLLKNAKNIQWMPEHIKDGRFGQWLAGARDWSISRQRFWGSVLPIWVCDKDIKHKQVFGSIKDLEKVSGATIKDLHKHFIDKITFKCEKCHGSMQRIPDVLDCWFEAGSMPYAQLHYPFENEKKFKDNFPAEFIAEGVDQTRAWFYYLHVLATALKKKPAFKHVVVNGIVLAEDGKKMSKRFNNYPDPLLMFEKYGADAVRYYLATSTVVHAEDLNFSEKGVEEVVKKVILILYNVLSFYKLYSDPNDANEHPNDTNISDKWIMAKLNQLISEVTVAYDKYDLNRATRPLTEFINELSTWYLRRSRDRFKGDDEKNKADALATLKYVLRILAKLMAPVMPFTAEHVWQELKNPLLSEEREGGGARESVHLQDWPKAGKIDVDVLKKMDDTRKIIEAGLAIRAQVGIKIRQPLSSVTITTVNGGSLDAGHEALVMDELNIGEVFYVSGDEMKVLFDTKLTDKLRVQGNLRELVRTINGMRKTAGLTPGDVITLQYQTDSEELKKVFVQYGDELKKSVIAGEIVEGEGG
ncbi:MAG: isoleucine--tRNA ligase, partial [Candidatus Komeilibacteria bacterium]|nr:isoleucine--tRNA ligase [Candidatus Komeilibacteria bacterium]